MRAAREARELVAVVRRLVHDARADIGESSDTSLGGNGVVGVKGVGEWYPQPFLPFLSLFIPFYSFLFQPSSLTTLELLRQ